MAVSDRAVWILTGCLLAAVSGCAEQGDYHTVTQADADHMEAVDAHDEHAHGPHGGEIIELGDHDLHAEVVYDGSHDRLTIHILGSDAQTPHAIDASVLTLSFQHGEESEEFQLTAAPAQDDASHGTSEFSITSHELMEELDEHSDGGRLSFTADGQEYAGRVTSDPHAGHSHEHGDHEHGDHEHGDHEHGDHEHGDHEHGDHEHGDHEHGDHEHGDHDAHSRDGDHADDADAPGPRDGDSDGHADRSDEETPQAEDAARSKDASGK